MQLSAIAKLDFRFSYWCLSHRFTPSLAKASKAVSHTGDGHLYVIIAILAWLFTGQTGYWFVLAGLLAFLIELPIYWLGKNYFKRRRPQALSSLLPCYITPSDQYSLPSGHTAAAFLMATLIVEFFPPLALPAYLWASAIGASRVQLGVHFLSDVLIGALLGMSCSLYAISIVSKLS